MGLQAEEKLEFLVWINGEEIVQEIHVVGPVVRPEAVLVVLRHGYFLGLPCQNVEELLARESAADLLQTASLLLHGLDQANTHASLSTSCTCILKLLYQVFAPRRPIWFPPDALLVLLVLLVLSVPGLLLALLLWL